MNPSSSMDSRRLARGFAFLTGLTFCLIVLGATVRINAAGLACPDWPLCFGQMVPEFNAKIALEVGHRWLAAGVSLGFALLTWLSAGQAQSFQRLKPYFVVGWCLLVVQVIFGGLTVLLRLAPWTVTVHLLLGNSFCLTLLCMARMLFEDAGGGLERSPVPRAVRTLAFANVVFLVLQIVLGGLVSSRMAGLACLSFPTCDGESFVPSLSGQIGVHVLHRLNGFALMLCCVASAWLARRHVRLRRIAAALPILVGVQIVVGVAGVLMLLPAEITALHTAAAAAIVLTTTLMVREVLLAPAG